MRSHRIRVAAGPPSMNDGRMGSSDSLDRRTLLLGGIATVLPGGVPLPQADPVAAPRSLPTAHAHNDYRQPRPLSNALALGFTSIEVDVFPTDDGLLVGHDEEELREDRTLDSMYLVPLRRLAGTAEDPRRGPMPDGHALTLLLDIKRHGDRALDQLLPLLRPLDPWLHRTRHGTVIDRPIRVILSGSRPVAAVTSMDDRPLALDGRIRDLGQGHPPDLYPLVSASMRPALGTFGITGLDDEAKKRLVDLVRRTHEEGRRLRFWGHAESRAVWRSLVDAGVDLIGTDQPRSLAGWLRRHDPRCRDRA